MGNDMITISGSDKLRSKSEALVAGPFDDLAVVYLDRLIGKVPLNNSLVNLTIAVLDPQTRRTLALALLPEAYCASRFAFTPEEDAEDWLAGAIADAMQNWKPGNGALSDPDQPAIDPEIAERELIEAFEFCNAGRSFVDPLAEQRRRLKTVFGIQSLEIEILALLFTCVAFQPLDAYFNSVTLPEYHRALALCVQSDARETKRLLSTTGHLIRMGFVEPDFFPPPHFRLEKDMRAYFSDPDSLFSFIVPIESMQDTRLFNLDSFPVSSFSRDIVASILKSGSGNILIHGVPGTGKTSFVTSMLRELKLPAFFLSALGGGEDGRPAILRIGFAAHAAENAGATLVIDESDSLINTEGNGSEGDRLAKAWLTEFMDKHRGTVIWIANDIDTVHDAVKRRYVYSLEFGAQTEGQRVSLWNDLVRTYRLDTTIPPDQIVRLAKSHEVNAGGIDIALRGLQGYLTNGQGTANGTGDQLAILSEFLSRHETLMTGRRHGNLAGHRREASRYLPEAINVDIPLSELVPALGSVAALIRGRTERAALNERRLHWSGKDQTEEDEAVEARLLFSGGPGTGKTAFAHWLSEALNLPLVQHRPSDLLGALVGATEQNIAKAFTDAEQRGAILLLDEADSLFIDRRHAERSWERSQTNELLTRMEDFSGILICCTNRREDFDPAAMRRFQWKLSFNPPKPEQRLELYTRYFGELCGPPDEAAREGIRLAEGLCPGDFAAVYKALSPLRAANPGSDITHKTVIARLRAELGFRESPPNRTIGFAV